LSLWRRCRLRGAGQDIVEADKPKTPNAGITVIEHAADSEAGRAISELERRERESNARDRAK
jgi:hypothetical protein